ncbi:ciliary microtubule-associated protein 3-like [Branchiostoma floridae x Branchiostoma japonicum]
MAEASTQKMEKISFGTTMDRKLFPINCAPTRFGNELSPLRGAPHRGPGCYDNEEVSNMVYNIEKFPICTKKGYSLGARTDPRFRKVHTLITPSPVAYQTTWTELRSFQPAFKPFEVGANRFREIKLDPLINPGPGTYEHDIKRNRQVSWPSQFGAPIHPIQPTPEKRTLKTELLSDKEFRKHKNRVAYLSLYWD